MQRYRAGFEHGIVESADVKFDSKHLLRFFAGMSLRLTQPPPHRFAEPMHLSRLQAGGTANIFQEMIPGFGAGLVIETRSLPALARCYPCSFTFYVADPSAPFFESTVTRRTFKTKQQTLSCDKPSCSVTSGQRDRRDVLRYSNTVSTVAEIECAIEALPKQEFERLAVWFAEKREQAVDAAFERSEGVRAKYRHCRSAR